MLLICFRFCMLKEIGRQPVLSFGNSGGDVSMYNYTIFNNRCRSLAFMLIADNVEQDYGMRKKWRRFMKNGKPADISMKDDFRTIYGDDVKKTGSFHWLENLAGERIPAESIAADAPEAR